MFGTYSIPLLSAAFRIRDACLQQSILPDFLPFTRVFGVPLETRGGLPSAIRRPIVACSAGNAVYNTPNRAQSGGDIECYLFK